MAQPFALRGRVVVLTGAAGHLGAAIASAFADAGARVVLVGRTESRLHELRDVLHAIAAPADAYTADLADPAQRAGLIERLNAAYPRIDVLVNNAYAGPVGTWSDASSAEFGRAYEIAVTAAFDLMRGLEPGLRTAADANPAGASVVNVGSMYGTVSPDPTIYGTSGLNNPPYYGPAKAALVALTRYAAVALAPQRIRVNAVSPGPFPPPSIETSNPPFHAELARRVPLGRIGRAPEVAGPIVFLASDAASYITGANLAVDGGWTAL
jgi:NAD(P)-dependent dehydrogenase (short-subunit alcohol dehydrogenase family)